MLLWLAVISASFAFFGKDSVELAKKFGARVLTKDLVEPAWVWLLVFGGDNFDDVALFELGAEADHLAVYNGASTGCADVTVETIGKI